MNANRPHIDLAGNWRIALDPEDRGLQEGWHLKELPSSDTLPLPGSLQEAGFGERPGPDTFWTGSIKNKDLFTDPRYEPYRNPESFKVPFWLQPPHVYVGACWFQRTIHLDDTENWMELMLERCHWFTTAWIGEQKLGNGESLCTPHTFRFQPTHSGEQLLTLRIDNRLWVDVGPNSHSVSDHTQTNWNGVIGEMILKEVSEIKLNLVEVDADPDTGNVTVNLKLLGEDSAIEPLDVIIRVLDNEEDQVLAESKKTHSLAGTEAVELQETVELGPDVRSWSPHHPNLYHVEIILQRGGKELLHHRESFGFVKMSTQGQKILLNGTPIQLRGTLDCAIFPMHGYPPTDIGSWETIMKRIRTYGLNHVRFHSWCPPEAAFVAGDRTGMIFQIECGSWANTTTSVGNGERVDAWLYDEGERIVRQFGNHPCFRLMAYGNEPGGPRQGAVYLEKWVDHWKKRDPRRLHTGGAGWPEIPESDFHNIPDPRLHRWGEALESQLNAKAPCTDFDFQPILDSFADRPVISHEIGEWCVYPDFDEIEKYQGLLKPCNLEIYRDFIDAAGLRHQAKAFHHASGRLQTYCYKAEIEAALRSRNLAGFQLLGLQDFSGQGTAPVGVLDAFWEPKDYVDANEFHEFCGDTVLLASMKRQVFREGETFEAEILCSHFGPEDLVNSRIAWRLQEPSGQMAASGEFQVSRIPKGQLTAVGSATHRFEHTGNAKQLELQVECPEHGVRNRWSVFVYPAELPSVDLGDTLVANEWQPHLATELEKGASVWLRLKPRDIDTGIACGFSSIFWNTPWTRGQAPHTLGILCDPEHPALSEFPTDSFSDVQWWSVLRHAAPMELDRLGWTNGGWVSVVPDWNNPLPLSIAFEARVGKGRVLVTSVDFDATDDPSLHQFEHSIKSFWAGRNLPEGPVLTPGRLLTLLE